MKKPTRVKQKGAKPGGWGSRYSSVKDARLRTTLELHDLCVALISAKSGYEEQQVVNHMFQVLNALDEFYEEQDG